MSTRSLVALCAFSAACASQPGALTPGSSEQLSASGLPLVPKQSGSTVGALRLITVTYPGSHFTGAIDSFGEYIVGSEWLDTVGAEYGVGLGTHHHVELHDAPPAQLDAQSAGALLAHEIEAGALPAPDAHTVYMYYAEPSTVITDDDPDASCAAFQGTYTPGYHDEGSASGTRFAFGVIPTCDALLVSTLEMVTSHEMIEAATDPDLATAPGYIFPKTSAWWQTGGELADLCDAATTVDGHTVSRVWSNAAAQAGSNPCLPAATSYMTVKAPTSPVALSIGSTATFPITGWALEATDAWGVYAMPGVYGGADLKPAIDAAQLTDGAVAHVTITAPDDAMPGATTQVLIYSETPDHATRFVQPVTIKYE